jgi:hypothetical protein
MYKGFLAHLLTGKAIYVKRKTEALSSYDVCCGKSISVTYFECMSVALVIQHAKRMRRIAICGLTYAQILPYFFTLSPTQHDLKTLT